MYLKTGEFTTQNLPKKINASLWRMILIILKQLFVCLKNNFFDA